MDQINWLKFKVQKKTFDKKCNFKVSLITLRYNFCCAIKIITYFSCLTSVVSERNYFDLVCVYEFQTTLRRGA